MAHDAFISFQSESITIVENICKLLEENDIICWYAPRDVREQHAGEIIEAIKACKVFIIVEDSNVASHPRGDILNEINTACSLYNREKIKIIRLKLTNNELLSADMIYYIGRIQQTNAFNKPLNEAAVELTLKINKILGKEAGKSMQACPSTQRQKNDYFRYDDNKEKKRLAVQQNLLENFDREVYDKLIRKSGMAVLDIGSNDGSMIMNRLEKRDNIKIIIGTELNDEAVTAANKKYAGTQAHFYQADCEDDSFMEILTGIMDTHHLEGFDLINLSMLILHLNNPYRLLKKVRRLLNPEGVLFIRDIDDGLNLAYPDPSHYFERVYSICNQNTESGFRHSGRQICTLLKRAGMHNIQLVKTGINTIGMSFDEKDAMFNTYFSFILEDARRMAKAYPDETKYTLDYEWMRTAYDELEEAFHSDEFFFQLGFMTYTASK